MARFENAIDIVLKHEGGYVNNPADPGGETKYGISKRAYPALDIKNLTVKQAKEIYRRDYWRYDRIRNQQVATKVFDMAVNMGPPRAHRLLQRALKHLGRKRLVVDGKFGPKTLRATTQVNPEDLVTELRALVAERYARLTLKNRSLSIFLKGWMRRAVS